MATMKKFRSEILTDNFANIGWRSANEAKPLLMRSRAVAATCNEVLEITNHLASEDQVALADDVSALQRTFDILDQMGTVFELEQRVTRNAEFKGDADREAEHEEQISIMVVDLFGTNPEPKAVAALAAGPVEF